MELRLLLSIAWRNLGRNSRRTLIAGSGIALGVGMCIATFGLAEGMNSDMVQSVTDVQLGHLQVHAPGFSSRPTLDRAVDHLRARVRAAEHAAGVVAVSPRAYAWALGSAGRESAGVQLVGVDPGREARVTHLDQRVVRGAYLPNTPTPWPEARALTTEQRALDERLTRSATAQAAAEIDALGAPDSAAEQAGRDSASSRGEALLERLDPSPEAPPPVLLGNRLAKKLHVAPGSLVALMAQDINGDPADVEFRVVGITRSGDQSLDANRAVANLADVQRFLGLGDRAHELAIRAEEPSRAASVAERLEHDAPFTGLEVRTWRQLRPDVVAMVRTNTSLTELLILIVFAAAGIGVADTIMMAVFERRRELGMLKAVGMQPSAIVVMVTAETVLLALGASLGGLGLGLGIDVYLKQLGLPLGGLSSFTLAGAPVQPILHASITSLGLLLPVTFMIGIALLAALWPAIAAARTRPVIAMRDR